MHSHSRRGLASVALTALLVLAPLASTAASADEQPTPVEIPSESPSEPAAPSGSRAPQYEYEFGPGDGAFPMHVGIADTTTTTATISWDTTYWGAFNPTYYVTVYDYTDNIGMVIDSAFTDQLSMDVTLTHGHRYWVSFNDGSWPDRGSLNFTFPLLPSPNAATDLSATRLLDANGFALSWEAPAENTVNPVTGYQVEVSNGSNSVFYTTTAPEFEAIGLDIGTTYGFAVVALSDDGQRANGVSNGGNLLSAVAPTAPATAVLTRTGGTLTASWTAPAYDGGASITNYSVMLLADGTALGVGFGYGGSYSFATQAEYDIEYSVSISANGSSGLSGPATASNTVERVYAAPSPPDAFAAPTGYKDPNVYVSWDSAVEADPAVESALLTLYNLDGSVAQQKTLTLPDDEYWFFDGLANNTDYTVGVVLINEAGSSAESTRVPVRTFGSVPPAATEEEVLDTPNYNNVTASFSGSQITAHIDDVSEGEWVYGTAYSTPTGLGWTQVDANGFAHWSVAGAGLATGAAHTLAVQNNFGAQLGFAAFAIPAEAAPAAAAAAALAVTGTDPSLWIAFGAGMLALGAVLMVRRRALT